MASNRTPVILTTANGEQLAVYAEYTKNVKEEMPAASVDLVGVSVLYLGSSTVDFTTAHVYTCKLVNSVYTWVDVTTKSGATTVGGINFVADETTGDTITLSRESLGVLEEFPEYEISTSEGFNITTDARLSRQWTDAGYVLTFLGGWPAGTYTAKTSLGNTYTRAEIDAMFQLIYDKLNTI